ncbi:alpha/beta fold hydrolase [Rhodohalobacter sp. 614A]|uniref:alpha/beta fold hydrolase n=1 Tax=Rhodohalobacter sp. 614A TaxID=2908649 RepID=UPI001F2D9B18|nr:alpha/beta fold hydrolase [Rhodohalobacter sp. 614A]
MKRFLFSLILLVGFIPSTIFSQSVPTDLTLKKIFLEPMIPGIRPNFEFVSGDQSRIFFEWNDSSYFETGLYSVDWDGNNLEDVEDDDIHRPVHSPDGSKIAYTKDDGIFIAEADGSNEQMIVQSQDSEYGLEWSPDSQKLAFVMDGNVWVTNVHSPSIQQITKKGDDDPNFSLSSWAGNEKLVLSQYDYSGARTIYFPEYVDEFVVPGGNSRGIPEVSVYVASFDTTALDTLVTGLHRSSLSASHDGRYVAIDWADAPLKHRKIIIHDLQEDSKTVVFEDSTDGWIDEREMEFAPEGDQLFFLSEKDGWNHIYTVHADGSDLTQHTEGDYYVPWAEWLDDESIVFASNEEDYGVRHIYTLDVDDSAVYQLTDEEAYRYQFYLTPDRSSLIYAKTFFNQPYDLYRLDLEDPDEEIQLTNSVPESFYDYDWQQEEYVRFTGRDGETELSASLLYPLDYDETKEYPVVVFVHGAGSLQNVYKGWSNNYWREYMFNQLLNKHGFIVLEVDYRHSLGYGRDFRADVTNWMGKYETEDIVDGLDWAEEHTGGALDLDRVGIYGGSYGGFMSLYVLTAAPERFHAGAGLRSVTNWRNYYYANPWYTLPRLGDPEEVPEHYDQSSPLTYADELKHPALLLHGLEDDNVGFQDAVQYIEKLIQSGNEDFDMMMYPSEPHSFTDADSWYDEYRRIFEFFEEELKE